MVRCGEEGAQPVAETISLLVHLCYNHVVHPWSAMVYSDLGSGQKNEVIDTSG